eukprot:SAG31_NODE_4026_length_3653_cov_19.795442_4_plen_50_part_00
MLDVKIGKKKLKVGLKGGETRLDGELFEAVRRETIVFLCKLRGPLKRTG